jgi:serine/threonine-protein kinase
MNDRLILDRYRLIERLAVGGSAEVWRAHDEQLDRAVAVKRLHGHLVPDATSRQRLAAEARAAAGLSHPVIVGVYDVDTEGDSPAIVMELVTGESLSAMIERNGPLEPARAASITADVADALFHAHQQGVIHRDVKPGNVLVADDGSTRLVDFGIAHSLAASAERLTLTGTVIGTLRAMAPEQLAGGPIGPRTDLYGLGVVLHEALTGRSPYPSGSPVSLSDAQRAGPPSLAGVDPGLAAIVAACLAYDPADRPLNAGALATALRAWVAGDETGVRPVVASVVDTSTVTAPIAAPAASVGAGDRASPRIGPRVALMGIVALLVAGFGGAWLLANPGAKPPDVGGAASPTTSAAPSATPPPTPPPAWLAKAVSDLAKDCGDDFAADMEAQLEAMSQDEAEETVDDLTDACKDEEGGRGNGNGGNGRGNDD